GKGEPRRGEIFAEAGPDLGAMAGDGDARCERAPGALHELAVRVRVELAAWLEHPDRDLEPSLLEGGRIRLAQMREGALVVALERRDRRGEPADCCREAAAFGAWRGHGRAACRHPGSDALLEAPRSGSPSRSGRARRA